MKALTFSEIAGLLNEVSLAKFSARPTVEVPNVLATYEGSYFLSNGDEMPAHVLYIYSGASEKALRSDLRKMGIAPHTEVVYAPSAEEAANAIDWRKAGAKKVVSSKEYIVAFMRGE